MSIEACLQNAVDGKEISPDDARRLNQAYEDAKARAEAGGAANAAEQARADLAEAIRADNAHKRRKAKLAAKAAQRIDADLRSHVTQAGKQDLAAGALDVLEHFGTARFSSVAGRQRAITGMAHARMEEALYHFRRGAVAGDKGRWNAAQLPNVVREAFGQSTGDAAAAGFAKSWTDTAEWLRQRFNAAGGAIGKLENWGLPQHHDMRALMKRGRAAWKADITPLLDVTRMRHPLTGKAVTTRELDGVLDAVYDSIVTEGWNDREPLRQPFGRGALANQRAEHRFLVFRDPESWMKYQADYGGGADAFSAMMSHINGMARDIAAMEILGPNPSGTVEMIKQMIMKEAAEMQAGKPGRLPVEPDKAMDYARRKIRRIDAVWGSIRGNLETPVASGWANGLAAARNLITSSVLGSAAISSVSDLGTAALARSFAGLDPKSTLMQAMRAAMPTTRREAVQAGLILDSAQHVFHAQARYVGTLNGPEWASYLADRVLTYSGLTPWTQAGRHAFGLAVQSELAMRVNLPLGKLPDGMQRLFQRYGITERTWDLMRRAPLWESDNGARLLRPAEIAERMDPAIAERYLEMIQTETEFAIPSGSHRSRTALLDQNQPGTFHGEVIRSFAQFKSFGAVFMLLHGARTAAMATAGDFKGAATYAGALLISTTLFGALALQMKQVAAGRDPRDMTGQDFWGAALLQGGGLGIYGDFLFSNVNRHGGGFSTTLAGPLVQRANEFWNLTAGNAIQLASGEKTNFGRELVKFARGNIPGGNIWYLRLAFERTVLDQVQAMVDPEANKAFKRQQQFWRREYDQEFYWPPGQMAPQRNPDITAVVGQ